MLERRRLSLPVSFHGSCLWAYHTIRRRSRVVAYLVEEPPSFGWIEAGVADECVRHFPMFRNLEWLAGRVVEEGQEFALPEIHKASVQKVR